MAWKVIKGKKLTPDVSEDIQEQPAQLPQATPEPQQMAAAPAAEDEGYGLLSRLGLAAGSGIEHVLNTLSKMPTGFTPTAFGALQEEIAKRYPAGGPLSQLSETAGMPQGFFEAWAQRFLKQAPTALPLSVLGPLGLAESTGLLGLGSGTGAGLQALGMPGIVQDIGQIATEIGGGLITKRIPSLSGRQQAAYTAAREAVAPGSARTPPTAIQESLSNVEAKLATETNPSIENTIRHAMGKISSNIEKMEEGLIGGAINPEKALDLRRNINRDIKQMPKDYFPYLKDIRDGINNFFAHYSAENPLFYEQLTKADKYTELKNMKSILDSKITDLLKLYPKAGKVASLLKEILFAPPERIVRRIFKSDLGRQHYFNMVRSTSAPTIFLQEAEQLKSILDHEEQEEREFKMSSAKKKEAPAAPQWKVIRGTKIQ